jgi:hypothetical protein
VAWTLIAHAALGKTGTTAPTTPAIDTTGAQLIVLAAITYVPGGGNPTPTDSKGNTWIQCTPLAAATNARVTLWYAAAPTITVGAGHTFTVPNGQFQAIAVAAFNGITPPIGLDFVTATVQNAHASPCVNGTVTPSVNGALVITACGWDPSATPLSVSSPFTISDQVNWVSGQSMGVGLAYAVQTTAAASTPSWSWPSGNASMASLVVVFAELSGPRVSQYALDAVTSAAASADAGRVSQYALDVITSPPSAAAVSQYALDVVTVQAAGIGLSQWALDAVLASPHTRAYLSQLALDVITVPPPPPPPSCSGGVVPHVADPPDGTAFVGLGPHTDRLFLELDLDTGREAWALLEPMNESPTGVHPGRKAGRLVEVGQITRRTTDRLGGWQASGAHFRVDDHDRLVRGLITAGVWFNREFRIYLARRDDVDHARCLGRFILREYPPGGELVVDVEGVDIVGSEFSQFALDRDVLGSVLFDKARVPGAPKDLLDAKRPIPIYMGTWSDESSGFAGVPLWRPYPLRGSPGGGLNGYGDLPSSATPPTSVTATAMPGGTLDPGDTWNDEFGFLVTAVDGLGRESDPFPFHMHPGGGGGGRGAFPDTVSTIHGVQAVPKATIDGTQKIRVSWSGATGAVKYRCYIGTWYYLARYSHYIETTATSCDWVSLDSGTVATFVGPNLWWYVVIARLVDGLTGKSAELQAIETGPRRVLRGWFTPIAGAVEYLVARRGTVGGFTKLFHVPATQLEGGYVYFDDDQLATSGEKIDTLPVPHGLLPIIDIGDEVIGGATWGKFCLARWAWHKVVGVYAGGARLSNTHADVRHPSRTDWPFPAKTRPLGDCDCTVIYLKGATLAAHRAGTAVVLVNGCTTEDVGDGTGSTITHAPRGAQHLITELVLNDHVHGPWTGIPQFGDGVAMVRSSAYQHAEAVEVARVGGTGYTMRLALDKPTPLRELLQGFVQSFGLHHGINRHGQIVCGHYDDAVDAAGLYPHMTDAREIVGDLTIAPRTSELETTIPYKHTYQPVDQSFAVTDLTVESPEAIARNRGKAKVGPERVLAYTADLTTITDVMARALQLGQSVRQWIEIPVGIVGLGVDVFDVVRVTDEAGLGPSGYLEAFVLVLEHEVRPPTGEAPLTVMLRGLDITPLLDAAWSWGPDSISTWDTMSADERGTYGAWASDTDTIPSDLSAAREWR